MAVATNLGVSPRTTGGQRLDVPRRPTRRPVPGISRADGRRPARLVAALPRAEARPCAQRSVASSLGWLVLAGALTFIVVFGIGWSTGSDAAVPSQTQVVQVRPGDTLWSVAHRLAPAASTSAVVDRIRQLNSLDVDSTVYPGELLRVPSSLSGSAATKAGVLQR